MGIHVLLSCLSSLLLFNTIHIAHSQNAGDPCTHKISGNSGVCKVLHQCPAAIDDIRQNRLPQMCGYQGTSRIVCCSTVLQKTALSVDTPKAPVGSKSKQKCKEYAQNVFTNYTPPVLSAGPVKIKQRNDCGFKVVELIVGGTRAKNKEFPHMAAIGYDAANGSERTYECGGSLISENYVVTAGHCFFSRENGEAKYVRVGDLNLATDDDLADPQEYNIAEFIRHPEYKPLVKYNDIGLIRLDTNVRFTPFVRPICLTTVKQPVTKSAIGTGWGLTGDFSNGSDNLLKVTLDFFSQQECYDAFVRNQKLKEGIVEETQICAGSKTEFKDTCNGDSGGPLQIYNLETYCMYTLVGITSFGKVCGKSHSPQVYTRVTPYIEWIENTVWP